MEEDRELERVLEILLDYFTGIRPKIRG